MPIEVRPLVHHKLLTLHYTTFTLHERGNEVTIQTSTTTDMSPIKDCNEWNGGHMTPMAHTCFTHTDSPCWRSELGNPVGKFEKIQKNQGVEACGINLKWHKSRERRQVDQGTGSIFRMGGYHSGIVLLLGVD